MVQLVGDLGIKALHVELYNDGISCKYSLMGKIIDKKLDHFVKHLLETSGMKDKELVKHIIIYRSFYEIKVELDRNNVSIESRKQILRKFILFLAQFETVCIRAHKSLSGSQSTADDIISMYSSASLAEATSPG